MSLQTMLDSRSDGPNGKLLKGSDVPEGTRLVKVVIAVIRQAPDTFGSPAIIDFEKPIYGKTGMVINKTNLRGLMKLFGLDEKDLVGKKVKFEIVPGRNPQTGQPVRSFVIAAKQ